MRDNRLIRLVKPNPILDSYQANYQLLGMDDKAIFRFCTHGLPIQGDQPAHLHDASGETIEEGDARLGGQSLVGIDFLLFFKYVCSYMEGNRLPWE